MATSLLRIGRLGVLKNIWRESVGVQRRVPAALYCTHGEEPVKPAARTQTAVEAAEAPGDRATLLAYKTTVAFPPRLSDSLSVAEPAGSSPPPAQTEGAAALAVASPVAAATDAAVTEPVVISSGQAPDPDVAPVVADAAAAVVDAAPDPDVAPVVADAAVVAAAPDPDVAPVVADAAAVVDAAPDPDVAPVVAAAAAVVVDAAPDPDVAPVVADAAAAVVDAAPDPDVAPVVADAAAAVVDAAPPADQTSGESLAAEDSPVAAVPDDGLPSAAASSELGDTAADDSSSSSSSSSTSDSDSDFDSDSDDEKSHVKTPAKAFPPADSTVDVTVAEGPENTDGQKEAESPSAFPAENIDEAAAPLEAAQVNTQVPLGSSEELVDSAPNVCTIAEDVPDVTSQEASAESREECAPEVLKDGESSVVSDTQLEPPPEVKADAAESLTAILGETSEPVGAGHVPVEAAAEVPVEAAADVPAKAAAEVPVEAAEVPVEAAEVPVEAAEVPVEAADANVEAADVPVEAVEAPVEAAADAPLEAAAEAPVEAVDAPVEAAADAPVEVGAAAETSSVEASPGPVDSEAVAAEALTCADSAEELVDAAPVITEAAGEELQAEAPAEQPEEAVALSPPESEEPFDNSTYKNYQHHSYNPYTFADLDLEMAKFRLPQPSSGRPSPRH